MKSVRMGPELESKLREAARLEGVSESTLIRQAIEQRCAAILGNRLDLRLAGLIGTVDGGGGRAQESGQRFRELLQERARAERREVSVR
ncbi:MAG: hypothetical protein ACR2JY_16770 [Chloroflexota bacterium]